LGSQNIIAGKAEDAENVLRIKAAVQDFETETNLSVICEDGSFYAFNVKYAAEPEKLNIEMQDFLAPTAGKLPSNRSDIYFKELGSESPILVKLIMQSIYQSDKRRIKHIGAQQFGMKFLLRGLYAHNGLLYFYTRIDNDTNMPFAVDFVTFKVVDKKVAKRTAMQEQVLQPLRAYHQSLEVKANDNERGVFVLEQFSLSQDKELQVTLYERGGGRTLSFSLDQEDLLLAQKIDQLKLKW
jgi:conjugative transposon TraN protein